MNQTVQKICKLSIILVIAASAQLWAGGQAETSDNEAAGDSVSIIDCSGREITIEGPVETIAYTHTFSDPLNILGVWERVVAVDGSHQGGAVQYPGIENLPVISSPGNCMEINYEKVMELDPDIFLTVYTPSIPGFEELVATLEPEIPVVAFNFSDPATMVENFEKLGKILGTEEAADAFISFYNGILNDIESRTAELSEDEKPRVFYKMGWGNVEELITFTDGFEISEHRSRVTGSRNIAADLPSQGGWVMGVDPEWLVTENPDIIIDGGMYHGIIGAASSDMTAVEDLYSQITGLNVLSETDAVRNARLYLVWTDSFMNTGYIINYAYLAKRFHPDLFEDLDPAALHQEYLTKYLKVDYDMTKQGIFVYP